MEIRKITVLDPTAGSTRKKLEMAVRPDKLEGKVVGLIWNSKPGGDVLLKRFAEQLGKRYNLAKFVKHDKPDAATGISDDALNEISTQCDFVIAAQGD